MTTPPASSPAFPLDWSADLSAIANHLVARGWLLATAESCTGGGIAAACTDVSGSSAWFDRGWVTYSNAAKSAQIGVDAALIDQFGAVSEPVARAMAIGAQRHAHTHIAIATTGIAGPTGGSPEKPVGLVWFAWSVGTEVWTERRDFSGDRAAVRTQAVAYAIGQLRQHLDNRQEGAS
ncbi:MAG: CinA family protein [Burkholderiaceae bacterium]|jgi:nicotinamide-nucleotide amidase|nr:CinA family protein [Burkholderiaceae bacterium]MDP4967464.1 CinA family protein [Burkholderiaceae bacterium]